MVSAQRAAALGLLVALAPAGAGTQPRESNTPDLSGTWKLDRAESEIESAVPYAGLGGNVGAPSMLYVTQAKNGTIIVGSNMNTSHARTYRVGGESLAPYGSGQIEIRSRWVRSSLVVEGRDGASNSGLRETLTLSADGKTLTVVIAVSSASDTSSTTLVYTRTMEEPPCSEWATPCRDWSTLALVGARVIDGRGGAPIESATMLVREGRIVRLGPSSEVEVPLGAVRVELEGKTITPGLINAHGHVGTTRGLLSGAEHYTEENIRSQLELYASYGVTTVASLGGGGEAGTRVRDQQFRRRNRDHARFLLAGPVVDAATPEAAREQVAAVAALGADLVKIRVDDFLGRGVKMSPEVYGAVIDEAHARDLEVAAHLFYLEDAIGLLQAGVDFLAHSIRDQAVDDELIELLLERDVCLCPTLTRELSTYVYETRPEFFEDPFFLRSADPDVLEQLSDPERQLRVRENPATPIFKEALGTASRNLLRLARAGVQIAFGTDSGPPGRFQGYFEHLELELMASAGLTPMEILVSATRDAARCLGLDQAGTLEPGRVADFLVLDADPLEDIRNLREIHSVWIGGRRVTEIGVDSNR